MFLSNLFVAFFLRTLLRDAWPTYIVLFTNVVVSMVTKVRLTITFFRNFGLYSAILCCMVFSGSLAQYLLAVLSNNMSDR